MAKKKDYTRETTLSIEDAVNGRSLKKGDFFKLLGSNTVWVYSGKWKHGPGKTYYHYYKFDDINHESHTSNEKRLITINFTF